MNDPHKQKETSEPKRKAIWPWVVVLIVIFCGIYSYERIIEFLEVNAEQLPFMFFDFVIEYFLGEQRPIGTTEV